jgi:hypothetical protein
MDGSRIKRTHPPMTPIAADKKNAKWEISLPSALIGVIGG